MAGNEAPRGILKNPPPAEMYEKLPPPVDREVLMRNTEVNASLHGDHSKMDIRPLAVRAAMINSDPAHDHGHTSGAALVRVDEKAAGLAAESGSADPSADQAGKNRDQMTEEERVKWDEANIYLTEQERTAKMKITEPKTPFAQSVDPSELVDYSDSEIEGMTLNGINGHRKRRVSEEVPELDLGDPEEPIDSGIDTMNNGRILKENIEPDLGAGKESTESEAGQGSEEMETEEERHRRFADMRKKHYEMKGALELAHQLTAKVDDEEEEEEEENEEEDDGEDEMDADDEEENGDK
ncbi:uncharacterized protein V1516DRAFT_336896 [Lipomyces oligophaga]|uniref:uncharacterized protein n=1 Tax=Lipomyces oligophaga TaxID=45792 RepID=UPI0034CF889D